MGGQRTGVSGGQPSIDLDQIRARLEAYLGRLRAQLPSQDPAGMSGPRSGHQDGADEADLATTWALADQDATTASNTQRLMEQTQQALERIQAGTYGLCASCGKPIARARLAAFPHVTMCLPCRETADRAP